MRGFEPWLQTHAPAPPIISPRSPVCRHTIQVKANGLVVFVPRYGIEGPVFLTDKDGNPLAPDTQQQQQQQQFVLDESKQALVAADGSGVSYAVFDKCAVRISVVEGAARRRSIKLALVPRSELAPEDVVS